MIESNYMFSLLKFIWIVCKAFPGLLNVNKNALKDVPDASKFLAMVMLSCFWCLAFGLYIGELLTIGYNMIGHIAIITMAFATGWLFRSINNSRSRGIDFLRMPDKSSRCDEYTEEQRQQLIKRI